MKSLRCKLGIHLLALWVVALSGCQAQTAKSDSETRRLDVQEFAQMVEQGGWILLDVRTPEEFSAGHIPGARNIDIQSSSFETEISQLDRKASYLVYCRSGRRSQVACQRLRADGFGALYELAPGFNGWRSADKPVE